VEDGEALCGVGDLRDCLHVCSVLGPQV
jgi:hypothetical protein